MDFFERLSRSVFIVAEIGNNHNGNPDTAKRLIDAAAEAGADAVKFQTFRGTDIVTPKIPSSEYPGWNVTQFTWWHEFLDSIALPYDAHQEVFRYARSAGVVPFSTPTSLESVDLLQSLNVPIYKIASMDVTNIPLLRKVNEVGKPVILSTGMADEQEIDRAVSCFDRNRLAILHCVSDYPLKYCNASLRSIIRLKTKYGRPVGFSDHSLGHDLSVAAVACGARIIEKHITLDRNALEKAEHHVALEPGELKNLVVAIRQIEEALGTDVITLSANEREMRDKSRRSLHINKPLKSGAILTSDDISVLRPADGALPEEFDNFVGKKLNKCKQAWDPLTADDL